MAHPCPGASEVLGLAMKKCPFLHNIAQTHGPEYASSLASKSSCPSGYDAPHRPLLAEDDGSDFSTTFALFHGRGGVLPLPHLSVTEPKVLYPLEQPAAAPEPERPRCPFSSGTPASVTGGFVAPLFAAAPLASMSMSWGSNWFNIHHLFQKHMNQHRAQQRKPPQQPQQSHGSSHGGVAGPGLGGPGASSAHVAGTGGGGGGGKCPLRRALGPLAGVVFNKHGQLSCPEPIIKMRAALAATRPVRELRPQALPIKLLAVAMTTAALNVPCGMWREHTEKFSSQWFLAVHATIPFIAMLRKAVIMPKYAILFTICAAIAGQAMGAKLERRRLLEQARDELGGLTRASPVAAGRPVVGAAPGDRQAVALPVASLLMSAQPLDRPVAASAAAATHGSVPWFGGLDGDDVGLIGGGATRLCPAGSEPGAVALGGGGVERSPGRSLPGSEGQQRQGQVQFRVKMRSGGGRQSGWKRGAGASAGSRLLIGRNPLEAAPVVAMVPC
ncbi:hypothetical protein PLESTF_001236800 [Pleodorina starrii]|nr:hypothetical protein PLESTM_000379600 [Pleodorina starrii]GLC72337.1 hypothetical protein PLESTF_001236800 [Pleodorina starrii]